MKIYELIGCCRSGHHAILNWLIINQIGFQCEWKFKMNAMGTTGFFFLNESNHDIPLSHKFIKDSKEKINILFMGYEDTPSDYTILNENKIYRGPNSLDYRKEYDIEYKGRMIFIRDFYNNLSSRLKANESVVGTEFKSGNQFILDVAEQFIYRWKSQARHCVENKCSFLKFEDWLNNKDVRDEFLFDNFGLKDLYGIKNIKGTQSSFGTIHNVTNRVDSIDIPENTKDLIRKDTELHYLIGALGYEYKLI
jgi:hypothetical protein